MELYQSVRLVRPASVHFFPEDEMGSLFCEKNELEQEGFVLIEGRLPEISKDRELLEFIAEAMKFPDYFGKNWSALIDCMSDMEWWPAKGYVLVLYGSGKIWREKPLMIGNFVECWLVCAGRWLERKEPVPFHLVFVFD
ncbi:conserved hypothetical protein [Nitrospina gracilis 3/211]|uniref:Barstar (barnase inhibitor) domain-containing protein n=1 Tax=Nitrospina gracilis (strain 3/211) TaxID=1266370 RepID=M1ZDD9_NITG3|nr:MULTISPECIES: barstar family protein [Nitrospina]MCF8724332.1 hypothetical protein [Nitrospina sp. Nb-3]CCQ91482.1 conserved hypothetical protein [Nitrospina gracilis 3/211]